MVSIWYKIDFCYSKEFAELSFLQRLVYYHIAMTVKRFFYYGPFSFTTGSVQAAGLGYNGAVVKKDEEKTITKHRWDKIIGVYVYELETSTSAIEMLRFWNHQVHLWLKFYVGARTTIMPAMAAFAASAFWHGFYPSYYVTFFLAAVLSEVTKDVYKSWVLFRFIPGWLRLFLANQVSLFTMNYLGVIFGSLTFEKGLAFMSATNYIVPLGLFVLLAFMRGINLVGIAKGVEKKLAVTASKIRKE